jgi:hypothetical protein
LKTLYNRLAAYKSEDMGKRRVPAENEEFDDRRDAA